MRSIVIKVFVFPVSSYLILSYLILVVVVDAADVVFYVPEWHPKIVFAMAGYIDERYYCALNSSYCNSPVFFWV